MVAGIKTQGVLAIVEKVNRMLMSYECVCIYANSILRKFFGACSRRG